MARQIREVGIQEFVDVFGVQGSARLTGVAASQFTRLPKSGRDVYVVLADGQPIEIVERRVLWSKK